MSKITYEQYNDFSNKWVEHSEDYDYFVFNNLRGQHLEERVNNLCEIVSLLAGKHPELAAQIAQILNYDIRVKCVN